MKYVARIILVFGSILLIIASGVLPMLAFAESTPTESIYYYDEFNSVKKDKGYSEKTEIKENDPHYGWKIGRFCVDGFSRRVERDGVPVFLKTVGDNVKLSFELTQDIDKLNNDEKLTVSDDKNGSDKEFEIKKTDFGRGTLIVKKTDYQNKTEIEPPYINYLAGVKVGAATEIELCEEGDYEVALDYEIRKDNVKIGGLQTLPSYHNYRIYFKFSVRNGNCMIYPFDVVTKGELTNGSITENGFYLDLANSRNLNIDIKKEIRTQGASGLTEDVRFNKPAKDHEVFTDEGIYTITARNEYTDQTTTKIIYVGTDEVLKAYAASEGTKSINQIELMVASGATITDDGDIIFPSIMTYYIVAAAITVILIIIVIIALRKHKKRNEELTDVDGGGEE